MANDKILERVSEQGRAAVRMTFDYAELMERVRARVAMLNHNLSPLADSDGEWVSWRDYLDEPLLKFSMATAASRVVRRLSAWSALAESEADGVSITLEFQHNSSKFYDLIFRFIKEIIYNSILADKLTFSGAGLRGVVGELRDHTLALADSQLEDLVCTMSIIE